MATLRILNMKGDTAVMWAPAQVETGDPEAMAAVKEAERIFREAAAQGATAFRVIPNEPAVRIDAFDPLDDVDTVIVPRIAGG
jgi:hypothetical protein